MKNPTSSSTRRNQGSALLLAIMLALVLMLICGSIVSWSLVERRANTRTTGWLEARNAAEAVAEYGAYQVAQAFNTRLSPTFGPTGTNPVAFPSSLATSYFANSHVDLTQDGSHNLVNIALTAGNVTRVPSTGYAYINPNDPNNKYDPLIGRYVMRRDVTILAKAIVNPTNGGAPIPAYVKEVLSIRGAPLLAYAIFYSGNDLEFNETPQMDIYGPVHVNGNLFVGPAGSSPQPLSFHGPVTASGNVFHAWRGTTTTSQEGGSSMSSTTAVNFCTDGLGLTSSTMVNMRTSGGVWDDSTMGADANVSGVNSLTALVDPNVNGQTAVNRNTSFSQYASQTWHGNLQTAAMGIQSYNPMGFTEVVAHDTAANVDIQATDPRADDNGEINSGSPNGTYGSGYGPHSLIEPPQAVSASDTYAAAKNSIEASKFSRKAGLYVQVKVNASNQPTINVYGDPNSAPVGTPASQIGPNGGLLLGTVPSNVVQFIPYQTTSNSVKYGMYDQHQSTNENLVQVDMMALNTAVTDMASAGNGTVGTDFVAQNNSTKWGLGTANFGYDPNVANSSGWNGGIYIDVQTSGNPTAVILSDGYVATGSSLMPPKASAPNGIDGLTIATNAPVYILGNLNANGAINASGTSNTSAMWADDYPGTAPANSAETPLAIAADAVTVLSSDYFGTFGGNKSFAPVPGSVTFAGAGNTTFTTNYTAASGYNTGDNNGGGTGNTGSGEAWGSKTTAAPSASGSVEIAAALITGTITTSATSSGTQLYSGGVHNLPRFLENWGSNTVAIRGSMVSMYNSRIATAGWSQAYYSAPKRLWGYDQLFASGRYPPIIPQVISYRRADFSYLKDAATYQAELSKL